MPTTCQSPIPQDTSCAIEPPKIVRSVVFLKDGTTKEIDHTVPNGVDEANGRMAYADVKTGGIYTIPLTSIMYVYTFELPRQS